MRYGHPAIEHSLVELKTKQVFLTSRNLSKKKLTEFAILQFNKTANIKNKYTTHSLSNIYTSNDTGKFISMLYELC